MTLSLSLFVPSMKDSSVYATTLPRQLKRKLVTQDTENLIFITLGLYRLIFISMNIPLQKINRIEKVEVKVKIIQP